MNLSGLLSYLYFTVVVANYSSEEPHIGRAKTQSKVLEVLHDYNTAMLSIRKKEALRLKAPTEKVRVCITLDHVLYVRQLSVMPVSV